MILQTVVVILITSNSDSRAGLYDGLTVDTEEHVNLETVSQSELTTSCHQDTVGAVSHEHGALDGAQEYLAVLAVVDGDSVGPVVQVDETVRAVLHLKLLT